MDRSEKPIVAIGHSGPGGMLAVDRAVAAHTNVVAVAEIGTQTPSGVECLRAPRGRARVGRAVREAVSRDAWWVLVPQSLGEPEYLLGSAVRSVAKVVDEKHPGVALLTVAPGTRWPYERMLVVVDPLGSTASGFAVWITVVLAHLTGAQVDVLAVGVPPGAPMGSREARLSYVPVERRADLLRQALAGLDALDVEARWIPGGTGVSAVEAVGRAVATGAYDVIVDDLGGARVRKRLAKKQSVKRLLSDDRGGAVPLWAMRNSGCDVVTVIDGIALGVLPAGVLHTGAVAAMSLGLIGASAPAFAAPGTSHSTPVATATSATGIEDAASADTEPDSAGSASANEGQKTEGRPPATGVPQAEDTSTQSSVAVQVDARIAQAHAWVLELGDEVSVDDHEFAMAALADVQKDAAAAGEQLSQGKAGRDESRAQVDQAQKGLDQAQAEAEPSTRSLGEARVDLARANAELARALKEHDAAQSEASGLTGLLPWGATSEDVAAAEAAVAEAGAAVGRAHAAEAERYADYQGFSVLVDEAEEQLARAGDDLAKAEAAVTQAKVEAKAAEDLALGYEALADEVDEAFRSQGLVAPATGGVTSSYGNRVHPVTGEYKLHTGTDFAGTDGNYYAAMGGTVSYAAYDSAYGNMVKIDHGEINGHHVETWYAHQPDLQVSVGQEISAGERLGHIGSTGFSTGPHAHFELRVEGDPIDPVPHIR